MTSETHTTSQQYRPRLQQLWHEQNGMTLLEILIVMVILGLIATLGITQVMTYLGNAKSDTAKLQIQELVTAVRLFDVDVGRLPTSDEGLQILINKPVGEDRWRGPYIEKPSNLIDPWGRSYLYRVPGGQAGFDISSYGADGQLGGDGENKDVSSADGQ